MTGLFVWLLACSEYNIGVDSTKGLEGSETEQDSGVNPDVEMEDTGTAETDATPDESTNETGNQGVEPSSEPVENDGLTEPTIDTDVGYDPNAGLMSNLGNVVTILMALSDQWIPEETAKQLIVNAVNFSTAVVDPSILVIRDDNTNGEDEDDPINIAAWLQQEGFAVTFMQEPTNGISQSDLAGFHVVIFSNPGHPPDDDSTIDALYSFSRQGYGVILQGDDMTRTSNPNMEAMTRLIGVDNGGSYHGVTIDNNAGDAYSVRLVPYNVLNTDIALESFPYGNDIDTTTLASSSIYVAAWATVAGTNHPEKPVITAYSPSQTVFQ
jgi:hypothetical protein